MRLEAYTVLGTLLNAHSPWGSRSSGELRWRDELITYNIKVSGGQSWFCSSPALVCSQFLFPVLATAVIAAIYDGLLYAGHFTCISLVYHNSISADRAVIISKSQLPKGCVTSRGSHGWEVRG